MSAHVRQLARRLPGRAKKPIAELVFRAYLRPTDVFLVGHPKSGNTWLAYMLAIMLRGGDPGDEINVANQADFVPGIHGDDLAILKHRKLPDPRVFRNEFPKFPNRYPRTLYMVRDPRAMLVSYYHHYTVTTGDRNKSLDDFVEQYLADGCILDWEPLVRWDEQVKEWMGRSRASVMIVAYEALQQDARQVMAEVADFCRIPPSEEAIAAALRRGGFQAMRSEEERVGAAAYLLDAGDAYRRQPGQRGRFFRQGRIDGWKDELSAHARESIESAFRPVMEALGYGTST